MKTYEIKELFYLKSAGSSDLGSDLLESDIQWTSASKVRNHLNASHDGGNWHEEDAWGDYPYRAVWINLRNRQVLTYCEGDVSMMQANSAVSFYDEMRDTSRFYKDN